MRILSYLFETNARRQKEERQAKQMAKLAMSAKEQIQLQVEQEIEPKLEQLLAQKIKPHAIRKKEKGEKRQDKANIQKAI